MCSNCNVRPDDRGGAPRALFLAGLPAGIEAGARLDEELRRVVALAHAAWPGLRLPPATFLPYVAARLPPGRDPAASLGELHAGDLYLACACAAGREDALALFETHFLSEVASYLGREAATSDVAAEVRQLLRQRLFVAEGPAPPKIASYSGRGPLGGWLRMTAIRVARNLRRTEKGHRPIDGDGALQLRAPGRDPELAYLTRRYSREFRAAFQKVLAELGPDERTILRLYFLDGLTVRALGELYHVNASTVSRRIAQAREKIRAETRRLLAGQLAVGPAELDSVLRLVDTQLELSLPRLLKTGL
jgi:RNA polymerase sigma-70 factor (ECF subfamily)